MIIYQINHLKKINIFNVLKIIIFSSIVIYVCIFFMSKKENLDIDEIYTYGITNNTFQLDIEDNIEYNGSDLLLKYASVHPGNEFNIKSVFYNQGFDTHPPLYYIFINFICSLNRGKFSIWYGLVINIIFMVILFWEMEYIIRLITKSELFSLLIPLVSLFFYGFINMYVFIRMYVQLSVISLGLILLILLFIHRDSNEFKKENFEENKINESNSLSYNQFLNNKLCFLILFFIICVFGILTQYHFMIIAGIYSLFLLIYLLQKKDYKFLLLVILTGILSILTAYLVFPEMINHLFGEVSLHGLKSERLYSIFEKLIEFYLSIVKSFSGNIVLFSFVFVFCIFSLVVIKNRNLIFIFISIVFYYIIISTTATFNFARYLYNIYSLIMIFISSTIFLLCKKYVRKGNVLFKFAPTIISFIVIFIMCVFSRYKATPFSLNVGDSKFHNYLCENRDIKTVLLYRTYDTNGRENTMSGTSKWKLPRPLYSLKDMNSLLFCDVDNINDLEVDKYKDENKVFVIIYTTENDDILINRLINKLNSAAYKNGFFTGVNKIYFNDYYHMYLLTKR